MASKADKERVDQKRAVAAAKIKEIAPHAEMMMGLIGEEKLDMLLIALGVGHVQLREPD